MFPGSGIETQSHIDENGRITIMFMAMEGGPNIMRLYGRGRVVRIDTPEFNELLDEHFKGSLLYDHPSRRAIIVSDVFKVGTSCGKAVPYYDYKGERLQLVESWSKKTDDYISDYWVQHNAHGLDGLPGMRHPDRMGPNLTEKNKKKAQSKFGTPSSKAGSSKSVALANAIALFVAGLGMGVAVATAVLRRK